MSVFELLGHPFGKLTNLKECHRTGIVKNMIVFEVLLRKIKTIYSLDDFLTMPQDMFKNTTISIVHRAKPRLSLDFP